LVFLKETLPLSSPQDAFIEIWIRDGGELKMNNSNSSIGKMFGVEQATEILARGFQTETSRDPARAQKGDSQPQVEFRIGKNSVKHRFQPHSCQSV
jgi:hypothetical protein